MKGVTTMSKKKVEEIQGIEEVSFLERCIYKILNDKKLDYLEKAYIHIQLSKRKEKLEKEIESWNSMGV